MKTDPMNTTVNAIFELLRKYDAYTAHDDLKQDVINAAVVIFNDYQKYFTEGMNADIVE